MRALAIVHQADAGPGVFENAIADAGWELETWSPPTQPQPADVKHYDAVLTFGGAMHPDQDAEHPWLVTERDLLADCVDREIPLLGVCLGAELVAQSVGGEARREPDPEIGWFEIELTEPGAEDALLGALAPTFEAFQWHSYACRPPAGAIELARSDAGLAAYRVGDRTWGIQFHAEVTAGDIEHWIADYESDPDAVRIGVEPGALITETRTKIAASNDLGALICRRFVEVAAGLGG